ncbi:MAG: fatty acid desaturase [Acidobacteria bacterium]|nr:fatty acid desaturase [Acidobacteriota bacterium]MBP8273040.1 fatty acid desaturase [Acidobacteriota bacterium]
MAEAAVRTPRYNKLTALPFAFMHIAVLAVFLFPFHWSLVAWLVGSYYLRMFAVTAGYHRYFSHRSFRMNRFWQFALAFLSQTSAQKGILWWASHHRHHHLLSDRKADVHSAVQEGFWWSHVGWILSDQYDDYDPAAVSDFGKYPELRWLDKYHLVPTVVYAVAIFLIGGWDAFVWGFVFATVILWHGTFFINSLSHVWGSRRFATPDESRNNFVLALVTLGEGWHNNHHYYMSSVRQGIRWWEVDITYYVLKAASWVGITRDLRPFRMPDAHDEHAA